jgi:hypothetical protein
MSWVGFRYKFTGECPLIIHKNDFKSENLYFISLDDFFRRLWGCRIALYRTHVAQANLTIRYGAQDSAI